MTFASSLLAKLLIAATVITPAAGYGGYCLYEYCTSSTFDKQITQQGYRFSPIKWERSNKEVYLENPYKFYENLGEDWRCTKQLFGNIVIPSIDANSASEKYGLTMATPSTSSTNASETDSVGCLVTDLGHTKNTNKSAAFLKWELSLRSGDRGFIYLGHFSAEKSGNNSGEKPYQTVNMIFEAIKESSGWNIKSGVYWKNIYSDYEDAGNADSESSSAKITLLNNKKWESGSQMCFIKDGEGDDKCGGKDNWTFERYVGFWDPEGGQKRVIDAIDIEVTENSKTYKHDVWSNDHFDFEKASSPTPYWKKSLSYIYDANKKEWWTMQAGESAENYLKTISKPWVGKKGTWTEATKSLCSETRSNNFTDNTLEAKRKVKFCYQKS